MDGRLELKDRFVYVKNGVKKFERNESLRQKARFMESPQCAENDHDFKYCKCFAAWVVDATDMKGGVGFQGAPGRVAVLSVFSKYSHSKQSVVSGRSAGCLIGGQHVKGFRNRWWVKG